MGRTATLVGTLALVWAAWLALVPFESPPTLQQVPINCGPAVSHTIDSTDAGCRASAQVRVQQAAIAFTFGVVVLVGVGVGHIDRDRLHRVWAQLRS